MDNFVLGREDGGRANSGWEGRRGGRDKIGPIRRDFPPCFSQALQNTKGAMEKGMHCVRRIVESRTHRDHMADQVRRSGTEKSGEQSAETVPHNNNGTTSCFNNILQSVSQKFSSPFGRTHVPVNS